ncbi:MAG: hypothetical protein JWL71_4589 [Acidobacteria bacterium]|nr:hypothetical protein [Acidobacteriota bacterium]
MARGVRHVVAAAALLAAVAYAALYGPLQIAEPIHSDGYSYYVYLPSVFIYHDPTLTALADDWYGGPYPDFTGIRRWPSTHRWLNLHPIGTAILMAPFFVAADLLTRWSNLPRDGFSLYYQHGAAIAAIVYFVLGLALLRSILRRQFSDGVVLATLIGITWGTNLFHYAVFDGTFSHVYAFFTICVWLWLVDRWWDRPDPWCSVALGVVAALDVLIRHTNAIYLVMLPLYGITRWHDVRPRLMALWHRRLGLVAAALAGIVVLAPQLALYKWITGRWIVNSYDALGMGFSLASPHVVDTLFSTQKGLFFWSPLLLLSVAGAFVAQGKARAIVLSAAVVFLLQTALIATWSQWQFGASFGHRGYTDGFALAAPLLAASFASAARHRRALPGVALGAAAAVLLSVAQMIQYWAGVLPMVDTTWSQYTELFLKFR